MNIIVTGAAGFIGSSLVDKFLSLGYQVLGIDNFDPYYDRSIKEKNISEQRKNPRYKFLEADLLEPGKIRSRLSKDFHVIVHLAAKAGVRPSLENPSLYQRVNVEGTQNIINLATEFNIKKIVFASSSSVYGVNPNLPWRESDINLMPISPYASSKIAAEWLGKTLTNMTDFDFISLRFFTVYGPKQRPDLAINSFFRKIKAKEPITVFGDGSTIRDYTYIDDIVEGIAGVISNYSQKGYNVFNLGSNRPIQLMEMIRTVEETLGMKAIIEHTGMQKGDAPKTYSDSSKARDSFGFEPKISFKDGIKKYYDWLK
jgi:UDP-glucuronate 4-epimerase